MAMLNNQRVPLNHPKFDYFSIEIYGKKRRFFGDLAFQETVIWPMTDTASEKFRLSQQYHNVMCVCVV